RNKKAKKTHLRQGGSLSIAEGEDLESQTEATAQVEEETRQSSSRQPRTKTGQQRYSVCRNTSHNAQT
ncbi:hypothetical protein GQ607_014720, partial [Colletotrichum asianum]